jgi:hypothetical protein
MRASCPYNTQPPAALWREAVSRVPTVTVDPSMTATVGITPRTVVASAGSCFAQHIRNHLIRRGYDYLITEPGPSELSDNERTERSFGIFPARFGNIYTTVQLWQLFERAYGRLLPVEDYWLDGDSFFDPYRPHVEPAGFGTLAALREDRERHLAATRHMFEAVEVFVFTLGLTEAWRSRIDGSVFPICPGCSIGTFDPARHEFINFGVEETAGALFAFIEGFQAIKPSARIVLTVSPVPLAATMSPQHVLQATTYSKSVLRVAAEQARERYCHVDYFPSYEIIMATGRAHEFFAGDRRTVTPVGVNRVMDLFFQCYAGAEAPVALEQARGARPPAPIDRIVCDEETVMRSLGGSTSKNA